jgi:AraC-like DNA-binding protein
MARISSGIHALSGSALMPWVPALGPREPEAYLEQIEIELSERIDQRPAGGEGSLLRDLPRLLGTSQEIGPAALRSGLGLTHRQLQRLMLERVGIDCQRLSSLQRLNRALKLRMRTGCSWVDAVFESGYSDQSHFVRHAKRFTGMTPTRLDRSLRSGETLPRWPGSARRKRPVPRPGHRQPDRR